MNFVPVGFFSLHACTDGTARIFWFASRVQSPQILALSSTFATLSWRPEKKSILDSCKKSNITFDSNFKKYAI